jgi:hypothetical protein
VATIYTENYAEDTWYDIAEEYEIGIYPVDEKESRELVADFLKRNNALVGITDSGNIIYRVF